MLIHLNCALKNWFHKHLLMDFTKLLRTLNNILSCRNLNKLNITYQLHQKSKKIYRFGAKNMILSQLLCMYGHLSRSSTLLVNSGPKNNLQKVGVSQHKLHFWCWGQVRELQRCLGSEWPRQKYWCPLPQIGYRSSRIWCKYYSTLGNLYLRKYCYFLYISVIFFKFFL